MTFTMNPWNIPPNNKFRSWVRLEPHARTDDPALPLQAQTADPLWMLARQWQMGEFIGEDAGSPILAEIKCDLFSIDVSPKQPTLPLETYVEREADPFERNGRMRVQIGQQFERFIRTLAADKRSAAELITLARSKIGLARPAPKVLAQLDYKTQRFLAFMVGRVVDGHQLLDTHNDIATGEGWLATDITHLGLARKSLIRVKDWRKRQLSEPSSAGNSNWKNDQLHYSFTVNAEGNKPADGEPSNDVILTAADYRNGELDWQAFSTDDDIEKATGISQVESRTIPTRVDVAGQSLRYWAFGDKNLNLSQQETETTNLAGLLFTKFIADYSDDWYSVNLSIPTGHLAHVRGFKVRDVFDLSEDIKAARQPGASPLDRWEMFSLSRTGDSGDAGIPALLIPHPTGHRMESEPLENVRFGRDEGANMVWAVEETVRNSMGDPVEGFEAQREAWVRLVKFTIGLREVALADALADADAADAAGDDALRDERRATAENLETVIIPALEAQLSRSAAGKASDAPRYHLATQVPQNWIPFLPYNIGGMSNRRVGHIALRRAKMWQPAPDPNLATRDTDPTTSIMTLDDTGEGLLFLEEEAVPQSGVRIVLSKQWTRGTDGRTFVWVGRTVLSGRGEASSGLKFDVVDGH